MPFFPLLTPFLLHQKADFEAHFIRVEKDIEFNIPDKDFSGYAIIGEYCLLKFYSAKEISQSYSNWFDTPIPMTKSNNHFKDRHWRLSCDLRCCLYFGNHIT